MIRQSVHVCGAGWAALTLREVSRKDHGYRVESLELAKIDHVREAAVTVNLVGLDSGQDVEAVAEFLQRQRARLTLSFVCSSGLAPELALVALESGAVGTIDSIESAKLAAKTIGRFFDRWPLSSNGPLLQQLPWGEFADSPM